MNKLPTAIPPILVVDDEKNYRIILSRILEGAGYRVLTAECPQTAMKLLQEQSVALILSDLRMPEIDGLELCRRVSQDIGQIPFILFSAFISAEDQLEFGEIIDTWGYLSKPFNNQAVLSLVEEMLTASTAEPKPVHEPLSRNLMSKKMYTYADEQENS